MIPAIRSALAEAGIALRLAVSNLRAQRRRTILLGFGLAAVTALFVLLSALAAGVERSLVANATALVTGHVAVTGLYKPKASRVAPILHRSDEVTRHVRAALPDVELVARGRDFGKVVSHKGALDLEIDGVEIEREPRLRAALAIRAGGFDALARPNTILLFESQLETLGVQVGDAVTLVSETATGSTNAIDCEVAAIAGDVGPLSKWSAYVSLATYRALFQLPEGAVGALHLHLPAHPDLAAVATRLRGALAQAGFAVADPDPGPLEDKLARAGRESWTGARLDVGTWEEELGLIKWMLRGLEALSLVLVAVLMTIVITGITNAMWIAVRERTREIGTLRALGMQRLSVARLFLLECVLLGAGGTLAGAHLGAAVALVLDALALPVPEAVQLLLAFDRMRLVVSPTALASTSLVLTAVTGLGGLLPALRASRLRPVVAMSHFD